MDCLFNRFKQFLTIKCNQSFYYTNCDQHQIQKEEDRTEFKCPMKAKILWNLFRALIPYSRLFDSTID